MASATMLEKYDKATSGEYACQLVLVVKEAAVLNARSGVICLLSKFCGLSGSEPCILSRTYVSSNPIRLNASIAKA